MKGGGNAFAALSVGSRRFVKLKTLADIEFLRTTRMERIARLVLIGVLTACGDVPAEHSDVLLSSTVVARFGSADSNLSFREIGGITLTQGNADTLLILQYRVPSVLVLTADGDSIGSIGRAGVGPGEFTAPFQPRILHDTVWIVDLNGTIKRFTPAGHFIDELRMLLEPLGAFQSAPRFVTALENGSLLYRGIATTRAFSQGEETSVPWVPVDRNGVVSDTMILQTLRHSEFRLAWGSSGPFMVGIHPADNSDRVGVDPMSRWIVTAVPGSVVDAQIPVRVQWQSFGDRSTVGHTVLVPAISSAPALDAWIEKLAISEDRPLGEVDRAVREQVPWPANLPAAQDLMVDNDGRAWLRTPHPTQDSVRWLVVDREHGMLGSLVLHASRRLHAAHGNTLWASEPGALDEPYIVQLRIAW